MRSELPDQGRNTHPLCWKAKSQPLDHQGSGTFEERKSKVGGKGGTGTGKDTGHAAWGLHGLSLSWDRAVCSQGSQVVAAAAALVTSS